VIGIAILVRPGKVLGAMAVENIVMGQPHLEMPKAASKRQVFVVVCLSPLFQV
jgi:hypothetical protein